MPVLAVHFLYVSAPVAFAIVILFKYAMYSPIFFAQKLYVTLCPGSVNVACNPVTVGSPELSIVPFAATRVSGFLVAGWIGVVDTSPELADVKSTLNLLWSGVTSADDDIVNVLFL